MKARPSSATIAIMRRLYLFLMLIAIIGLGTAQAQDAASDLFNRVNGLRASLGLAPYRLNSALAAAAQDHAQWMAATGQVTHTRSDGSTPRTRAAAYGYSSSWVSENIYMGGLATADDAWNFWLNSAIHYAGMTNRQYQEIGVGVASGPEGQAFVLVFGNPGPPPAPANNPNTSNNAAAPPSQPSFVVGVDERGNIMHEIQPGDTLGDIALIYGYTWDDIPYMLSLNHLTEEDARFLEVGSIFLVPPKAGTYTPTPEIGGEATTEATDDLGILPTLAPSQTPTAAPTRAVTESADAAIAAAVAATLTALAPQTPTPSPTPEPLSIISLPTATAPITPVTVAETRINTMNRPSPLMIMAIIAQIGIIALAGLEFLRRSRR